MYTRSFLPPTHLYHWPPQQIITGQSITAHTTKLLPEVNCYSHPRIVHTSGWLPQQNIAAHPSSLATTEDYYCPPLQIITGYHRGLLLSTTADHHWPPQRIITAHHCRSSLATTEDYIHATYNNNLITCPFCLKTSLPLSLERSWSFSESSPRLENPAGRMTSTLLLTRGGTTRTASFMDFYTSKWMICHGSYNFV